mmetsp:Transcript_4444/g.9507  ORF Transcript_4444/g.9507 Transcript_4444/m.9507 type:complete len:205 (+) Transcript_4444:829-1443(+)
MLQKLLPQEKFRWWLFSIVMCSLHDASKTLRSHGPQDNKKKYTHTKQYLPAWHSGWFLTQGNSLARLSLFRSLGLGCFLVCFRSLRTGNGSFSTRDRGSRSCRRGSAIAGDSCSNSYIGSLLVVAAPGGIVACAMCGRGIVMTMIFLVIVRSRMNHDNQVFLLLTSCWLDQHHKISGSAQHGYTTTCGAQLICSNAAPLLTMEM